MKYCAKCGWQMQDDEVFCRNCGTKSASTEAPKTYTATYYDDTPTRRLSKGTQTALKVFLILAIVSVVLGAGQYLLAGVLIGQGNSEIVDELFGDMPEFEELLEVMEESQLDRVLSITYIVSGVISLIPLCWVLPMRKKILRAMNDGTTLTTGFKVCTLIFVSVVCGIILLCSKDI